MGRVSNQSRAVATRDSFNAHARPDITVQPDTGLAVIIEPYGSICPCYRLISPSPRPFLLSSLPLPLSTLPPFLSRTHSRPTIGCRSSPSTTTVPTDSPRAGPSFPPVPTQRSRPRAATVQDRTGLWYSTSLPPFLQGTSFVQFKRQSDPNSLDARRATTLAF